MTISRAPYFAVGLGLIILVLKLIAYWLSGSVALLSDALESIVNVVAAIAVLITIREAAKPPDADHPFGHSKIEYLSAILEGILIVLAALLIGRQAWERFQQPSELKSLGIAALISLIASALNAGLAAFLVWVGRRERSPALLADGMHLWTDVVTSVGVLVGVGLAWLTGWWWLDPLLALLVAANILWVGWHLLRDSVGGLIDEGLPDTEVSQIQQAIEQAMQGALEVHDLRTRRAGRHTFVTFHLVVPGHMPVSEAHDICDQLEVAIHEVVSGSFTTIHVEPEEKAHHKGFVVRTGG